MKRRMLYAILPRPRARERTAGKNGCIMWYGIDGRTLAHITASSPEFFFLLVPYMNHSHPLFLPFFLIRLTRFTRPSFGGRTIQTILERA